MDRKSWNGLASALAQHGVHVLTFDYRGYGDTPAVGSRDNLEPDIDLALAALARQPGVDKSRLAAGGASCGVSNAIQLARRNSQIRALVLLSGTTSKEGLNFLRQHPALPIFAAASNEEAPAVSGLNAIVATSTNPLSIMRVVDNAGHGAPMFDAAPALLPHVVDWVSKVLR
jgi:dienelactone hydrolase